jgi:hypothetical protein
VVAISAAVEDDLRHAGFLRPLRDEDADLARGVARDAGLRRVLAETRIERRRVRERRSRAVVDDLRVDVARALEDGQPRPLRVPADCLADPAADLVPFVRAIDS